jgi:hypothetical protein
VSRAGVLAIVLCACGRLAFDPHGDGGIGSSDARDGGDGGGLPSPRVAFVKPSNPAAAAEFGHAVAISGDGLTVAVGASLVANEAGAVYVFRRTGDVWAQEAIVTAANAEAGDQFGWSVALSGNGNTLAVGARREDSGSVGVNGIATDNSVMSSGAAYVFTRAGTTWTQQAYVKASNTDVGDSFGQDVALSADGLTLAVAAPEEDSNATMINGNSANNLATEAGAVYVYTFTLAWAQQAYMKPSNTDAGDQFGWSIALASDGSTLAVGAYREDSGVVGSPADNSSTNAGAAYVFTRSGNLWTQRAYLKAPALDLGDNFGYGIAISNDGSRVAVSAEGESSAAAGVGGNASDNSAVSAGALYVFAGTGTWAPQAYVKATNPDADDQLGFCVTLSGDGSLLAGGAFHESSASAQTPADNSLSHSGAAYTYRFDNGWQAGRYLKAPNAGAEDTFGWSCAASQTGATLVVGAPYEDSSTAGIDGTPNEGATDSGAAYIYY